MIFLAKINSGSQNAFASIAISLFSTCLTLIVYSFFAINKKEREDYTSEKVSNFGCIEVIKRDLDEREEIKKNKLNSKKEKK